MNSKRLGLLVAAIIAVIGVAVLVYYLVTPRNGAGTTAQSSAGKKILYWRDPMDPTMTSDKPGKSPMGMDMVPVYEGDQQGGVKIDPTTLQNIGVRYERAEVRSLKRNVRTSGKVEFDERTLYFVNTKISGWVDRLYVNTMGQRVRKGERLLEIYSPELVSAEEEYIIALKGRAADSARAGSESLLERAHRKLMFWDIPHDQIVRLESTRQVEKTMALVAPAPGVVVEKNVLQGGNVAAGTNLFKIADLSTVWVTADVYEYEVPFVKVGQQATVTLAYDPGKTFHGRVAYVYPTVNPDTRTVRVRLELPNPDGALKPDMFATVEIESPVSVRGVAIPEESVIHSGERNVVVVSRGSGRFESRDVVLGVLAEGYYQVKSGINAGDSVVVSSQFLLDSESNLKAAVQQMTPGSLPPDTASLKQQLPGKKKTGEDMEGMEGMKKDKPVDHTQPGK
jgi:multidrug efflux pump subunit AcrA (membrane-fusion protein)